VFNEVTMTITAEKPADILIRGNHLWRSTVVTLEGQPADNITVLPDMKGIVARFDSVSRQWVGADRRLWVFTSEGEAYAGQVTVESPTGGAVSDLTRTATKEK